MALVDLSGVKADEKLVPAGTYMLRCKQAQVKNTKSGTGKYIWACFEVAEGDYHGKTIFHNFNIQNPNAQAQEIGLKQLKSFLENANANAETLESAQELVGLSSLATVKVKPGDIYDAQNVITSFKKAKETKPEEDVSF